MMMQNKNDGVKMIQEDVGVGFVVAVVEWCKKYDKLGYF